MPCPIYIYVYVWYIFVNIVFGLNVPYGLLDFEIKLYLII